MRWRRSFRRRRQRAGRPYGTRRRLPLTTTAPLPPRRAPASTPRGARPDAARTEQGPVPTTSAPRHRAAARRPGARRHQPGAPGAGPGRDERPDPAPRARQLGMPAPQGAGAARAEQDIGADDACPTTTLTPLRRTTASRCPRPAPRPRHRRGPDAARTVPDPAPRNGGRQPFGAVADDCRSPGGRARIGPGRAGSAWARGAGPAVRPGPANGAVPPRPPPHKPQGRRKGEDWGKRW